MNHRSLPDLRVFSHKSRKEKNPAYTIDQYVGGQSANILVYACANNEEPVVAASDGFVSLSGYSRTELVGKRPWFLADNAVVSDADRAHLAATSRDDAGSRMWFGKLKLPTKAGDVVDVLLRLRSFFMSGKRYVMVLLWKEDNADGMDHLVELDHSIMTWFGSYEARQNSSSVRCASKARAPRLSPKTWPPRHAEKSYSSRVPDHTMADAPEKDAVAEDSHHERASRSRYSVFAPGDPHGPSANQRKISVVLLPKHLTPEHCVENALVVAIQHRATATVVTAMGEGAVGAQLCGSVYALKNAAKRYRKHDTLLCGEHERVRIPGLDKDNSPRSFITPDIVDKTLLMYTTNGTRAIPWVRNAKILVIGSFLNLSAIIGAIMEYEHLPVILLCCGHNRCEDRGLEDELCATYILHNLVASHPNPASLIFDDSARLVMQQVDSVPDPWEEIRARFHQGPTSLELGRIPHLKDDVDFCLQVDRYPTTLPLYSLFLDTFLPCSQQRVTYEDRMQQMAIPHSLSSPRGFQPLSTSGRIKKLRLFIIRHGEYEKSIVRGMAGHLNPPLSAFGCRQASDLAQRLASESIHLVVCSPLRRAATTAEVIAFEHSLTPQIDTDLLAIHRGDWSGLTVEEVKMHFPGDWQMWQKTKDWKEHGGESYEEIMNRVRRSLRKIIRRVTRPEFGANIEGETASVAIVAHCSIVCAFVTMVQSLSQAEWVGMGKIIQPASATVIEFQLDDVTQGNENIPLASVKWISMLPNNWEMSEKVLSNGTNTLHRVRIDTRPAAEEGPNVRSNVEALVTPFSIQGVEKCLTMQNVRTDLDTSPWGHKHRSPRVIHVVPLPKFLTPEHHLENSLVVLIDVLRMTSTMVTAMGEGLNSARMFSSVLEVKHAALRYDGKHSILGGEQKRCLIPGFNRDNSPLSYMKGVQGKTALMLTTNGTRAMPWVKKAKMLVLGSFLNVSGLTRTIMHHAGRVDSVILVCAGCERGTVRAPDDELCAAYILKTLITQATDPSKLVLDGTATQVLQRIQYKDWSGVTDLFHSYPAADELRSVGMEHDLDFCLQRDAYADILPVYHSNCDVFMVHRVHYKIPLQQVRELPTGADSPTSPKSALCLNIFLICSVNPQDQLTGRIDPILGEEEEQRARNVARLLSESTETVHAVACSPLRRARATSEVVAAEHGLAPVIYNGLTAVDYGDWTGLMLDEVKEHFPGEWEKWNSHPSWDDHGGESYNGLMQRTRSTFSSIVKTRTSGSICIVSHQSTVRSIVAIVNGLTQKEWGELVVPQASLTHIRYYSASNHHEVVSIGVLG